MPGSGHPGCGLSPVSDGVGVERSCTCSFGGRIIGREVDRALVWPAVAIVVVDSVVMMEEALRAACFCWATAMGERMSLMCFSMKTGFFLASLSFWKRSRGFSS